MIPITTLGIAALCAATGARTDKASIDPVPPALIEPASCSVAAEKKIVTDFENNKPGATATNPEIVYVDTVIVVPASPWHSPVPEPAVIDLSQAPGDIQDVVAKPRLILINEGRGPAECRFRNIRIADTPDSNVRSPAA